MSVYNFLVTPPGEGFTFNLEEGTATRNNSFRADEGVVGGCSYAAQLNDGSFVQLYTSADKTVQLAASGSVIGYIDGDVIYENPSGTQTTGNYTRARANVVLVGYSIHKVKMIAANAAVGPGDSLALDSTKLGFDKEEDTTTNIIALETAGASSGLPILALVKGPIVNEAD